MYPPRLICATSFTVTDGLSIFGIVLLIILSAFFSASETAFTTANAIRIKNYADEKVKGARRAQYIVDNYDKALVSLLVGNNLVNIASTTLCAYMFSKFIINPTLSNLLNTVVMTIVLLIFGEILPKAYAKHNPEKFALKVSGIIFVFMKIIYIIAMPFYGLQKLVLRKKTTEEPTITEDEFESIVDTMEEEGILDSENAEMIQGVLDLSERTVQSIMIPRVDMEAIPIDISADELKQNFVENQYSRLPVYEEDKDNIIGILNQKDFMISEYKNQPFDIKALMTEPLKVPKSMKIDDLIKVMQKTQKHIAIVVDEYGGTSGLVTMEDALEEVVGEIYDEHDDAEKEPITKIAENKYNIDPDISVEELFEYLEIEHLPETNYPNIGGLIYEQLEHVPQVGDKASITAIDDVLNEHNDYVSIVTELEFVVDKCEDDRITNIILNVKHLSQVENKE